MSKLYELTEAYARILALAEDSEDGEWQEALAGLQGAIEEKAENIAMAVKLLEGDAGVLKAHGDVFYAEAQRLLAQAKTRERRVADLKDYMKANMEALGLAKLKAGLFTWGVQNNSTASCRITNAAAVPLEYQEVIPARMEIDTEAIKAHYKATGEQVPGAVVVQGTHARIR